MKIKSSKKLTLVGTVLLDGLASVLWMSFPPLILP
jgi:hypothetical protein